ncbi:type I polyketide synthase [Clostridium estertheticum]|uniref:type I polyketide synthase n=1 Tax=Clostridium estertheticum TaxID=238834 RepID=UPI001C0E3B5C|nr:beta-ketoacyl synthase N-terminal-like domain-containing protein [Clostridium estertheticum]MBU3187800.1 polyketide synthase dehydratase domain-containing protein [Clostridium estertheticum]
MKKYDTLKEQDIAIIGMACRFPGADGYNEFWDNLKEGVNSIKEIPIDRWDVGKYYSSSMNEPNRSISKWCGLIDNIYGFDNKFFNVSPREARNIDPQQRFLLEETWHCIEDSGISLGLLQEKNTSVYIGAMAVDYGNENVGTRTEIDSYSCMGAYECMLANRISYMFNFHGASVAINAACASSLVAIHQAKCSLIRNECNYAIAGSVNLNIHPWKYISFSKAHMLSPDGQCKTFDKDANGYVPGDGVGTLLLQRLDDAIKDGNHIYGIIKGSSINHGGRTLSATAPSVEAQRDVILAAYKDAGLSPAMINYVEAHGTGTSLGDPIEIEALTQAFQKYTNEKQFCSIASVKSNIGHLEGAAGIAGVIKILLMMKHRKVPMSLNINVLNPVIDFENTPFKVATSYKNWEGIENNTPLRAGVSSFGFGGVNSHIILEEYIEKRVCDNSSIGKNNIFILSANTNHDLENLIDKWKEFVEEKDFVKYQLKDICMTLLTGREILPYRYGMLLRSKEELKEIIKSYKCPFLEDKKRSWCLIIGNIPWGGYEDIKQFFDEFCILKENLSTILKHIKSMNLNPEVLEGFYENTWTGCNTTLYKFVAAYAYVSSLINLGFSPDLVIGEMKGIWLGLAVSGIIKLDDVIKVLSGIKELHEVKCLRPSIPFYDQLNQQKIMPFYFDEEYLQFITKDLDIEISSNTKRLKTKKNASFKELLIENDIINQEQLKEIVNLDKNEDCQLGEILVKEGYCKLENIKKILREQQILEGRVDEVLAYYIDKARLLNETQYTFKKYLEEWNEIIKDTSEYEIMQLLHDDRVLLAQKSYFRKEKLLLMVAIISSLRKLNQRWSLTERKPVYEQRFYELLDLVSDGVMSQRILVRLLIDKKPDFKSAAKILNKRQKLIDSNKPYVYLKEINKNIKEIQDTSSWINDVTTAKEGANIGNVDNIEKLEVLKVGEVISEQCESINISLKKEVSQNFKKAITKMWTRGIDIQWKILFKKTHFTRVSLPVYSFNRNQFCMSYKTVNRNENVERIKTAYMQNGRLHPLIGENISKMDEQIFATIFTGNEFYIKDHVVNGLNTFPGVAYIEMARAAAELSTDDKIYSLKNIVWKSPITIKKSSCEINISLHRNKDVINYEVWTNANNLQKIVHGQGIIEYKTKHDFYAGCNSINIDAIKSRCPELKNKDEIYNEFKKIGLEYGTTFQSIQKLYNNKNEALSEIELPLICSENATEFLLHPSLIDGALQTAMALVEIKNNKVVYMPFSLGKIEIVKKIKNKCYVYVTQVGNEGKINKYNIQMIDESGQLLVNMKELLVIAIKNTNYEKNDRLKDLLCRLEDGQLDVTDVKRILGEL